MKIRIEQRIWLKFGLTNGISHVELLKMPEKLEAIQFYQKGKRMRKRKKAVKWLKVCLVLEATSTFVTNENKGN